jgi:dipeptidyl aminopeptidase/acylaminoacyl peptidase
MNPNIKIVTLGLLLCAGGDLAADDPAVPITLERIFGGPTVRDLAWSPDGQRLAGTVSGEGPARVTLFDISSGARTPLTEGSGPVWSPDGRRLAFLRGGDVWAIDAAGGTPARLTSDKDDERMLRWSPDGRHIAFASIRSGHQDIWVVPSSGGPVRKLTDKAMHHDDFRYGPTWSPDGKLVAFVSNRSKWENDDLWVVPVDGGAARQVTRGVRVMSQPVWAADGRTIAFNAMADGEYWYGDMSDIYVADVASGVARKVKMQVESSDRNGGQPIFLSGDGATAYFVFLQRGEANLWAVPTSGGVATQMTELGGNMQGIAFSSTANAFAFVHSTPTQAGILKVLPVAGGEPRTLASFGPRFERIEAPASIVYRSFDGLYIPGFLFKPPDFDAARKYPALVQVHGGGNNLTMNGFNGVEQLLAHRGYVVLAINYRGSSGYGRPFQDLATGDWGGNQARDAAAAADFLRAQPYTSGKVGIYGGSYGGITTMAAITLSPDTFDAAVPMRGIYDFAPAWDEADRLGKLFFEAGHQGSPQQNPAAYKRSSSLARVDRIKTPMLVMHGGRDVRAPARQHVLLVEALKKHAKTFEEHVYGDEAHGFGAGSQVDMYGRLIEFFDRHLKK